MTEEERIIARRHIAVWKETGQILDRMKWDELKAMTESQSAEIFALLDTSMDTWRSPERRNGAGLVEQQRWFAKAHESRRSS